MKFTILRFVLVAALFCFPRINQRLRAEAGAAPGSGLKNESSNGERAFGIEKRVPWTASRITGSPEPPSPYQVERVFPKLKFTEPVDICNAPGTDRLFVAELSGKIFSFPARRNHSALDQNLSSPDLFFDMAKELPGFHSVYGITFHPGFETNRYLFICYVLKDGLPDGTRVSRFVVSRSDPPQVQPESEKIIITWLSGGHNGGCLKFGPEGDLYISTGDGAGPNPPDPLNTGQDLSDLLSSVLRIDVDHPEGGKAYRVPGDNPFIKLAGARPEIWAFGLRNPWKMSFDKKSGDLWLGDVGWELWEMIYRVQRGGNYGWSIVEGPQSIKPDNQRGPGPILPPVAAHPHSEAASITGGFFYYGQRLKELIGAYVYGDWATGKIWGLRYDGNKVIWQQELIDTPFQIICFGEDNSGELYVLDYGGMLFQLVPRPLAQTTSSFPRKLSETGLFFAVDNELLASGVIPYSINAEPWADHAVADRYIALPGSSHIDTTSNNWIFPKDAVLVRTFSIEMERGKIASRHRLETQILHFDGDNWNGYSYQWNPEQTDAVLVSAGGTNQLLRVIEAQAPGGYRAQTWHYQSRAECMRCHNSWDGYAIGFNPAQLNKDHLYRVSDDGTFQNRLTGKESKPQHNCREVSDNQLRTLAHIDVFNPGVPTAAQPKLTNPYDPHCDLNERARSWLQVNCAHCHREGAGGSVLSHFNYELKLEEMKTINFSPSQGTFGMTAAHVISPGDPFSSVLYYRISTTGQGRMPYIGSTIVDLDGAKMIHDWIQQLGKEFAGPESQGHGGDDQRNEYQEAINNLASNENASAGALGTAIDRALGSTGGALALLRVMDSQPLSSSLQEEILRRTAAHPVFQVRDLFERFLPEEKRVKKLGSTINPEEILALKGDAVRGRQLLFHETATQCQQCHRIYGQGRDFGPDLTQIGKKYTRAQILESILQPSKTIAPEYTSYQIETEDDQSYTGFVVKKTSSAIVLKQATGDLIEVPLNNLKLIQPSKLSAMPEQLLQNLTAQNAADLLEFLQSLR